MDEEQHWKGHDGDLITMNPRPKYPVVVFLTKFKFVRRLFTLKKRDDRIKSGSTTYVSQTGLEILAALICLSIGLLMTFGSIWGLNFVNNRIHQLAVITGSGTLLTAVAWLAAGNRPFEILATFAAYMAVLMIFLQIDNK